MYISEYENENLTDSYLYREMEFDLSGNIIKQIDYNDDSTIDETETYIYGSNNKKIQYSRLGSGVNTQIKYYYNDQDSLSKEIHINDNSIQFIDSLVYQNNLKTELWRKTYMDYEYDKYLDIMKLKKITDSPNELKFCIIEKYSYDHKNRFTDELSNPDDQNNFKSLWKYEYDSNNNMIKAEYFGLKNGKFESYGIQLKTYDSSNNLVDHIGFDYNNDVSFHFKYDYDINKKLIRNECIERDPSVMTYEYSKHGRLIKEIEAKKSYLTGDNLKWVYEYKYFK